MLFRSLLTVFRIRSWLAESIPLSLKSAFAAGIGLFITFVGLNETGIVTVGLPGAPVKLGDISQPSILLAFAGLIITALMLIRKVNGALLYGMMIVTAASVAMGITKAPSSIFSLPPSIEPIFFKLDIAGSLKPGVFPIVLVIFIMALLDTIGTLIGLSVRADLLDKYGNLPEIERPMMADAVATMLAPILGTSTTGAFIESAAGIEAGGRTGFTALVVAALFGLSLFIAPIFSMVPPFACGVVLVLVGSFMLLPITRIDYSDHSELIPSFLTITLMVFTYNIGIGMTAGLFSFVVLKLLAGKGRDVAPGMWVLAILSLSFFIFMPKG